MLYPVEKHLLRIDSAYRARKEVSVALVATYGQINTLRVAVSERAQLAAVDRYTVIHVLAYFDLGVGIMTDNQVTAK